MFQKLMTDQEKLTAAAVATVVGTAEDAATAVSGPRISCHR